MKCWFIVTDGQYMEIYVHRIKKGAENQEIIYPYNKYANAFQYIELKSKYI